MVLNNTIQPLVFGFNSLSPSFNPTEPKTVQGAEWELWYL